MMRSLNHRIRKLIVGLALTLMITFSFTRVFAVTNEVSFPASPLLPGTKVVAGNHENEFFIVAENGIPIENALPLKLAKQKPQSSTKLKDSAKDSAIAKRKSRQLAQKKDVKMFKVSIYQPKSATRKSSVVIHPAEKKLPRDVEVSP